MDRLEPDVAAKLEASVGLLSALERRALVTVVLDGPQPLDRLADVLGATVAAVGVAARALVTRGVAVRVPRGRGAGLPVLVSSTAGRAIVRDALRRPSSARPRS